jgi:hypothetical protein
MEIGHAAITAVKKTLRNTATPPPKGTGDIWTFLAAGISTKPNFCEYLFTTGTSTSDNKNGREKETM